MPLFRVQEGQFNIPSTWEDETKNTFYGHVEGVGHFTLMVTRDAAAAKQDPETYATRQMAMMQEGLPSFNLMGKRARRVGNQSAYQVDFSRNADGQTVFQRQVYVPLPNTCMIFTITCQKRLQGQAERQIEQMLISFETA